MAIAKLCLSLICLVVSITMATPAKLGNSVDESRDDVNTTAMSEVELDDYDLESGTKLYYMSDLCGKKIILNNRDALRVAPWRMMYPQSNTRCHLAVESYKYRTYQMVVTFRSMEMSAAGGSGGTCRVSRLDLYDGLTTSKLISGSRGICGTRAPKKQYTTESNAVFLEYSTGILHHERQYFDAVITPFHYGHCNKGEFKCVNGRCVNEHLLCDGYNNCGDDSDETHCKALFLSVAVIVLIVVGIVLIVGIIATIIICKCCCAVCGYERL